MLHAHDWVTIEGLSHENGVPYIFTMTRDWHGDMWYPEVPLYPNMIPDGPYKNIPKMPEKGAKMMPYWPSSVPHPPVSEFPSEVLDAAFSVVGNATAA